MLENVIIDALAMLGALTILGVGALYIYYQYKNNGND
jgi:hypothetical protein